jgi:arylsulfatase A-like enzyme
MQPARDVILVTIDSLRADRCGFMGCEEDLTPTLDRMAEEGLVFENAISPAGTTRDSASSFLTGHYPIDRPDADSRTEGIRDHLRIHETVPERFSRLGYRTAAFTANPWTSRYFIEEDVFDHFEDFMSEDASERLLRPSKEGDSFLLEVLVRAINWWQGQDMFMSWEAIYDDVRDWIETARRGEEPYFLWIFLVDAHMPFLPPKGYRSQSRLKTYPANAWLWSSNETPLADWFHDVLVQAYDDTVRYSDAFLDRLGSDVGEEPLIVAHADHGEEFGENGYYGHGRLFEPNVHVPFVVANGPTGTVREPFSLYDLPELLVDLAAGGDGRDVTTPVARARNAGSRRVLRGDSWRYARMDGQNGVFSVADGATSELRNPELEELGATLLDQWRESERERSRIARAAANVGARGEL